MSMIVPVLIGLVVAGGSFTYIYEKSNIDTKENIRTLQTTKSIDIVNSGLYLMESELNKDGDWRDALGVNIDSANPDANGYYSLNSTEMNNKLIKEYPILGGSLNIYIKPIDSNNVNVIAEGAVDKSKSFIALKLSRRSNYNNFIPLMYGGKSASYTNTTLCTYVQDSSNYGLMGVTNANLSLYFDGISTFKGLSINEGTTMSSGDNAIERDLKIFADTSGKPTNSFDINGNELLYDKVYSTGSVGLYNGATVNEVVANQRITNDYSSCLAKYGESYCGTASTYTNGNALSAEVRPDNYVRPDFKDEIIDNIMSRVDNNKILVCGNSDERSIAKYVPDFYGFSGINSYTDAYKINAWNNGKNTKTSIVDSSLYLSMTSDILNEIRLLSAKGTTGNVAIGGVSTSITNVTGKQTCSWNDPITSTLQTLQIPANYPGGCSAFDLSRSYERSAWLDGYSNFDLGYNFCNTKYPENDELEVRIDRVFASAFKVPPSISRNDRLLLSVKNTYLNYGAGYENVMGYYWENERGKPIDGRIIYPSTKYHNGNVANKTNILKTGSYLYDKSMIIKSKPDRAVKLGFWLAPAFVANSGSPNSGVRSGDYTLEKWTGSSWTPVTEIPTGATTNVDKNVCDVNANYPVESSYNVVQTAAWNSGYSNYTNTSYCETNYLVGSDRQKCNEGSATAWGRNNVAGNCDSRYNQNTQNINNSSVPSMYNGIYVEYFNISGQNEVKLTGTPKAIEIKSTNFNMNFGSASPYRAGGINSNNFGIRVISELDITTRGNYTFYVKADDRKRLFIDGNLINLNLRGVAIDTWLAGDWSTEYTSDIVNLTVGKHQIVYEMKEGNGLRDMNLKYSSSSISKQDIPLSSLFLPESYYNSTLSDSIIISKTNTTTTDTIKVQTPATVGQIDIPYNNRTYNKTFNVGIANTPVKVFMDLKTNGDFDEKDNTTVNINNVPVGSYSNNFTKVQQLYTGTSDSSGNVKIEIINGSNSTNEVLTMDNLKIYTTNTTTSTEEYVNTAIVDSTPIPAGTTTTVADSTIVWNRTDLVDNCDNGQGFNAGLNDIDYTSTSCSSLGLNENEKFGCEKRTPFCPITSVPQPSILTTTRQFIDNFLVENADIDFVSIGTSTGSNAVAEYRGYVKRTFNGISYRLGTRTRANGGNTYGWLFSNPTLNPYDKSWEVKGLDGVVANGQTLNKDMYLWEDLNGNVLTGNQITDLKPGTGDTGGRDIGYQITLNRLTNTNSNTECKKGVDYGTELKNIFIEGFGPLGSPYEIINVTEMPRFTYEYEYFIINNTCNFDLQSHDWKFGDLIVTNNSKLTFLNPGDLLEREEINLLGEGGIVYDTVADDDFLTIKSNNINLGADGSYITCTRIDKCLIDTNNLSNNKSGGSYARGTVQGTLLARNDVFIGDSGNNGFEFIGNVFSEQITSTKRTYCNVVGSDSNQVIANTNDDNFLSIVSNNNGQTVKNIDNVSNTIMKAICTDINDCATKLQ